MILGLLAMIVANAATVLGARSLLPLVKVGRPAADFVLFLLLRLLLISAAVLIAGLVRGLTPLVLGLAGGAALALQLARGAHRGLLPPLQPSCPRWLVAAFVIVAIRLLLQVWFLAPYAGDTLSYHLPKVAEWVRAGGIIREMGTDPRSAFPAGFELIEIWWVVFLHHDVLIELAGVEFLILAGAAAAALARELGWSEKVAALGALTFVLTPGLQVQATACLNDGPVAALLVATMAMIVAKVHPLLLLVPLGLGIGIKPTFVYALPGLLLTAALLRRKGASPLPSLRAAGSLALVALGIGSWWYLRNWVIYGSPIYPMGSEGMRSMVSGATMQRIGPSLRALRENLACFLDIRVYDRFPAANALGSGNFNWGAASFALGAPALIPLLRSEAGFRPIALGFTVSLLCIFSLVELDPWYARFVLFLPVLTSLALARMWEIHRGAAALGVVALAFAFLASSAPPTAFPREKLARMVKESWFSRASSPPPKLPQDGSPIGYLCDDFGAGYCLYGPDFSQSVVVLRDETIDSLIRHAEQERVSCFYVGGALRRRSSMLAEGVRRGLLKRFVLNDWIGYELASAR